EVEGEHDSGGVRHWRAARQPWGPRAAILPRVPRALPIALLVALTVASIETPRAAAQPEASRALLIGSSSVNGAVGRTLERELGERGVTLVRRARSSSGFARPDFFDWEEEIGRLGPFDRYAVVIIYAG